MLVILSALIGLVCGSFVNAAAWRIHENTKNKKKLSILNGRSMCPDCRHQLAWYDLVPVFSWLELRGRCRYCKKAISVQYPLVEAVTAGLFVWSALIWNFSNNISYFMFVVWLLMLTSLALLAVYDIKWMILPNKVLTAVLILALIQLALLTIQNQSFYAVLTSISAAVLGGGFFYGLYALGKGKWMGGGDVKLVFCMGLILGLGKLGVALMLGFISAAVIGVAMIIAHKGSRKSLIPFGPFLIGATIIAQLYGQQLIGAYLRLAGIS
jgi:prepilin signal peptidase PulO-like enzyme (type II secretory pathway)